MATAEYLHYSVFGEPWWLDAVCGPGGWDEVRVESDGRLEARLPFVCMRRRGLKIVGMPPLTQKLGPWFAPVNGRDSSALSRQRELTNELIGALPSHDVFRQCFHSEITNWLPWYWKKFDQTTRYSYVLSAGSGLEALWDGMQSKIRGDVRKATARSALEMRHDLGVDALLELCRKTANRQGRAALPSEIVKRIVAAAEASKAGKAYFAVDATGAPHAAVFMVWDDRRAYYILGGGDPALRNSGAHSFLLWEAIKDATTVSRIFDFEGSMVPSIERFFRGFGASQEPYSCVSRISSRYAGVLMNFRAAWNAWRSQDGEG